MIIVDTSVWVDHFRKKDRTLIELLENQQVLGHPFVIGELACGSLANRQKILALLQNLPGSVVAADNEVLLFIEKNSLVGIGIGYIDAHLLASAKLGHARTLWTRDKRLRSAAEQLELAYHITHRIRQDYSDR